MAMARAMVAVEILDELSKTLRDGVTVAKKLI